MNHQVKRHGSKRVADYFTVVGCSEVLAACRDQENCRLPDIKFKAYITDRYPPEDRPQHPLPDGSPLFCYPNGIHISTELSVPTFHSFVLTSDEGARTLGSCLTFYEPLSDYQLASYKSFLLQSKYFNGEERLVDQYISQHIFYSPRCVCLFSDWTYSLSFKSLLCGLYELSLAPCSIPLERYICNIIDDIPAPMAGRVDVTYYLGDKPISFRCPPFNEPNVWAGLPLFPLFECLSPSNIISLVSLVLTERQILFISSQYSLLTVCAEGITSLIYPFSWTHAYVPILPTKLIGMLAAPFPFILGIHSSMLQCEDCCICEDTTKIFLDSNTIDYGSGGPPPPLPDKRARKLLSHVLTAGKLFEGRGDNWELMRQPHYDDAFSTVAEKPGLLWSSKDKKAFDESMLRNAFLQFFVAIFKDYRKHLIFGSAADPDPIVKFDSASFIAETPSDWQPLLREMVETQLFSQFIDLRTVEINHDADVIFFDESIDAKMNRYTFRFRNVDTPFLQDNADKYAKTYVPPSPDVTRLEERGVALPIVYDRFPSLDPSLYVPSRSQSLNLSNGHSATAVSLSRLKRSNPTANAPIQPPAAVSCVIGCYLVAIARVACFAQSQSTMHRVAVRLSTVQLIEEYAKHDDPVESGTLSSSTATIGLAMSSARDPSSPSQDLAANNGIRSTDSSPSHGITSSRQNSGHIRSGKSRRRSDSTEHCDSKSLSASAKLAVKIGLEILSCLSSLYDEPADDAVYRALVDACGACGLAREVVDLIVHMSDEGMVPDNPMLSSVAKALASSHAADHISADAGMISQLPPPAAVWSLTDQQWRHLQVGTGSIYRRRLQAQGNFVPMSPISAINNAVVAASLANGIPYNSSAACRDESSSSTSFVSWLLGNNSKVSVVAPPAAPVPPPVTAAVVVEAPTTPPKRSVEIAENGHGKDIRIATPTRQVRESTNAHPKRASERLYSFPDLEWKNLQSLDRRPVFVVSPKLRRHMILAEELLVTNFPDVCIDIEHPIGMSCPGVFGKPCLASRAQSLREIYSGWDPDPNKYTCKCFACGREFVPRFTVMSSSSNWIGSEGPGTLLWCELLSPWTLRKELFNIIIAEGVEYLISSSFRTPSGSNQHAVLFWNAVVAFRLFGLPFSFLLVGNNLPDAFPPKPNKRK